VTDQEQGTKELTIEIPEAPVEQNKQDIFKTKFETRWR